MSGLMLTFRANPAHLPAAPHTMKEGEHSQKSSVEMSVETSVETPGRIVELLREHPHLTWVEVAAQIGKSVWTVERASAKLINEGRLRRVGPRKGGHWEVLK